MIDPTPHGLIETVAVLAVVHESLQSIARDRGERFCKYQREYARLKLDPSGSIECGATVYVPYMIGDELSRWEIYQYVGDDGELVDELDTNEAVSRLVVTIFDRVEEKESQDAE